MYWIVFTTALCILALVLVPRKKTPVPVITEDMKKQLFLKEEKDTKRYFEDIRNLYPL